MTSERVKYREWSKRGGQQLSWKCESTVKVQVPGRSQRKRERKREERGLRRSQATPTTPDYLARLRTPVKHRREEEEEEEEEFT